jgi:hypothetical protein
MEKSDHIRTSPILTPIHPNQARAINFLLRLTSLSVCYLLFRLRSSSWYPIRKSVRLEFNHFKFSPSASAYLITPLPELEQSQNLSVSRITDRLMTFLHRPSSSHLFLFKLWPDLIANILDETPNSLLQFRSQTLQPLSLRMPDTGSVVENSSSVVEPALTNLPAEILQKVFWLSLELNLCHVSSDMRQKLSSFPRVTHFLTFTCIRTKSRACSNI